MNKSLMRFLLAMILLLGILAACSGEGETSSDGETSEGEGSSTEEASSGEGEVIHIGVNLELSGAVATYGHLFQKESTLLLKKLMKTVE